MTAPGVLDEAYERVHRTGPEFGPALSNHAPMGAECLVRLGRAAEVHRWLDGYLRVRLLPEPPSASDRIPPGQWRDVLGQLPRAGDWVALMAEEIEELGWVAALARWWPRLLPGSPSGATHPLIRSCQAIRSLREVETAARRRELAEGLGYWAARWQPLPVSARPAGGSPATAATAALVALASVPGLPQPTPDNDRPISGRLMELADLPGWREAVAAAPAVSEPAAAAAGVGALAAAALTRYSQVGYRNPVMLVHAVTAPSAVLLALPALPRELWVDTHDAVWAISAAVLAAYVPTDSRAAGGKAAPVTAGGNEDREEGLVDRQRLVDHVLAHGDEHVIKLAEAALRVDLSGGRDAAAATAIALELVHSWR